MWFPLVRYKVAGHSMEPFFRGGDQLIVNRLTYFFSRPKKDDIIVLKHPEYKEKFLLKRIDKVLPNNQYFVAGYNKGDSNDSRFFGPVRPKDILGKVLFTI